MKGSADGAKYLANLQMTNLRRTGRNSVHSGLVSRIGNLGQERMFYGDGGPFGELKEKSAVRKEYSDLRSAQNMLSGSI